jgi:hypothetical protein
MTLLELYTSEGCDSCPPADRWVSALRQRGLAPDRVVTLGFHVDYWNSLGWIDPFAKADHVRRQREASQRNGRRFVYTPQLLLNGREYPRGVLASGIAEQLDTLARKPPLARIRLTLLPATGEALEVRGTATVLAAAERQDARAYVALYENSLASEVTAGENRGERLRHDFVVRDLAGPFAATDNGSVALDHRFPLAPRWKHRDLHVAAFVQNRRTGDVLQALDLPRCPIDP